MNEHSHYNSASSRNEPGGRKVVANRREGNPPSERDPPTLKCDRVQKFLHGLKVLLRHHGAPSRVVRSFYKQAYDYLDVPREEVFLKRAKDLILVPMSDYLRNERPAEPDRRFEPAGAWRRWSRQRLHSFCAKNTHLWFSFLQGKRAAEQVSSDIVLENFQKHRAQMLSPDPIGSGGQDEDWLESLVEEIRPILTRVSTKLRRKFLPVFQEPESHTYSASEHASLESGRKTGGQKAYLRSLEENWDHLERPGDLVSMKHHIGLRVKGRDLSVNPVTEVRVETAQRSQLTESIRQYSNRETHRVERPRLEARVEAVLEPFKVRTISKGPAVEYDGAKPMQKAIHSILRKMKPFRLIGRPLRVSDLSDIREAQLRFSPDPIMEDWLSIDYSAATDGLSASLSQAILEEILGPLKLENSGYYHLLMATLAPHLITYPKVSGVQLDPVEQQNGQLMGSPLSFPVLCLANLALYLRVRRETRPGVKMKDLLEAVLINGDDMIYVGNHREWLLHHEYGAQMGLAMSPGKAYRHPVYANINSVCVHLDLHRKGSSPKVIPFFNVGLLLGNHKVLGKVGDKDGEEDPRPVSGTFNEVIRGALPGKQAAVAKMFMSINAQALRAEGRGRNLFLPTTVGGLGQELPLGLRTTVTDSQWEQYQRIREKSPWLTPGQRPFIQGYEILEVEDVVLDPLKWNPKFEWEGLQPIPRSGGHRKGDTIFQGLVAHSSSLN